MAAIRSLAIVAAAGAMLGVGTLANAQIGVTLRTTRVATALQFPTFVTHAPGDPTRLFILEKPGRIKILDLTQDPPVVLATNFLNITTLIGGGTTTNDERGLLGLAFHPDYPNTPYFYVNYTATNGATTVRRYSVDVEANPNVAVTTGSQLVMVLAQPFSNHNGGWMGFGPDGYLYISTGDGGSGNDPGNRAQTIVNQKLGKMLRVDINGDDFPGSAVLNYANPPTNPFVDAVGDDEIWAYGLRNPWRSSFDRLTGDLWIGDVGQNAREEIDFQAATDETGANGGLNYGWRCMEGLLCTGLSGCTCNSPELTNPVHQWVQSASLGRSVTGGYRYRGCQIPEIQGRYFFSDWISPQLRSFQFNGTSISDLINSYSSINPSLQGDTVNGIVSFGEDAYGELYIVKHGGGATGQIFRLVRDPGSPLGEFEDCNENGVPDECEILGNTVADANNNGIPDECEKVEIVGDLNGDGIVDGADLGLLLNSWGKCRGCPADLNGDLTVDGADLGLLLSNWTK